LRRLRRGELGEEDAGLIRERVEVAERRYRFLRERRWRGEDGDGKRHG
jgi:hypothetical protein